jgi:ERO1-like protein beta
MCRKVIPPVDTTQRVELPGCYYRDSDFCFLDDMTGAFTLLPCEPQSHSHLEGDYIDLSGNPERFTGYVGPSAHRVWKAIYEENCFEQSESSLSKLSKPRVVLPDTMAEVLYMKGDTPQEQCLEKKVYYKVISGALAYCMQMSDSHVLTSPGLHASISTHICYEHLNQTTGQWVFHHSFISLGFGPHYPTGT